MGIAESATDAELMAAASADAAAFERLYRRYVRRVSAFAAARCSSPEDVADTVAETFVRLLDAAERYDPERGEAMSFVLGIAAHVIHEVHRRRSRAGALVTKLAGRDLLDGDDIERVEAALDAARTAGTVHDAVAAVPPGEQAVLRLVVDGRTPGQAAQELGISSGAAWTRLSRARRRIRTRVVAPGEEE
jgi:RNA polymerase sigma factor (sigma-70 family)